MSDFNISMMFFLQLAAVLTACWCVGRAARWLGQPEVVGHMIAGVLLGPSLLGQLWPDGYAWLFPRPSRTVTYTFAQVGLAAYMFIVGMEFRLDLLRERRRAAAAISLAGVVTPFALGAALAWHLYERGDLFGQAVQPLEAMLFLGAALSITAFPMLARIISERGLAGSSVGTLLLAAGAIDDALAWCVLALVLSIMRGDVTLVLTATVGAAIYATVVLAGLRPMLARWLKPTGQPGPWGVSPNAFLGVMILLALGAYTTDAIGIYAVFGAFIMGVAVPRGPVAEGLIRMMLPCASVIMLPFFFVNSGLNTRITLINTWSLWGVTALVIAAATAGKFIACAVAARCTGSTPRDSVAIGAMMNARGLMELIILNIGLEAGVITPVMFSVGVLMAIITTVTAVPVFDRFWSGHDRTGLELRHNTHRA
ncbi:MAG: cation:proton antiporter [Phycisphaerae bacterium]|jgi:Kef-type K+ transport system membrane component KefB